MTESKVLKYYAAELASAINAFQLTPAVTIDDIPGSLAFTDKIKALHNYHNGQRKLFLSEIEFLTMMNGKANYFVYAGSAPGWKNFYLSILFPKMVLVLVDPNPFEILYYEKLVI